MNMVPLVGIVKPLSMRVLRNYGEILGKYSEIVTSTSDHPGHLHQNLFLPECAKTLRYWRIAVYLIHQTTQLGKQNEIHNHGLHGLKRRTSS